jgi:3-hydroxyisobutyrate dehydrogenase-like beta-hydroxyacid dehydrogenase
MSTIAPGQTRAIASQLAAREARMIDAPVTGSAPRAADGSLTIMAGGDAADFERALPLLQVMGELVAHVGETGQGEMLKLINNAVAAANASAVAEALVLASATGIDLDQMVRVVSSGSGASTMLSLKGPAMSAHDYTTLFKTAHMLKDVRLCLEAGVPFPAAAHARDLLTATMARGHAGDDFASVIEAAEGLAGRVI